MPHPTPDAWRRIKSPPMVSIQVLRAIASLLVVIHHAGYDADTIAERVGAPPLALESYFDWTFGIHLFFVISGFIILRASPEFGRSGAVLSFVLRRIIRIVPLYWLMTSLFLVGATVEPSLLNVPAQGWGLIFCSYAFIPVLRAPGEIRPLLGQGWTLNYEMFFYCLFAVALLFPRRLGLVLLGCGMVGLVLLGRLAGVASAPWVVWTDAALLEFLLGMLLALAYEAGFRLAPISSLLLMALGLAAAIGLGPISNRFEMLEPWMRSGLPAAAILGACVLTRPGAFTTISPSTWLSSFKKKANGSDAPICVPTPSGRRGPGLRPTLLDRLWTGRPQTFGFAALGDASYSLYLCHPFLIRPLRDVWLRLIGDRCPIGVFLLCSVALCCGAGLLLYRIVERPMTIWLQHHLPIEGRAKPIGAGISS